MKSLREHMDEEQLELTEEQLEELMEGRVGIVAKSAIAVLRTKQQGRH